MNLRAATTILAIPLAVMTGCCAKRYIAFTTATKFALDVSQKADQTIDVSMGYDRAELASIPSIEENASGDRDTYSVLGTFRVKYGNPFTTPLVLNQTFATGVAARNAAASAQGRAFFAQEAATVEKEKLKQERARKSAKGHQP
jgi:hypothetical protein